MYSPESKADTGSTDHQARHKYTSTISISTVLPKANSRRHWTLHQCK